jgi:hypothetical protein
MFIGEDGFSASPVRCDQLDVEGHSVQQFLKVYFQFQDPLPPRAPKRAHGRGKMLFPGRLRQNQGLFESRPWQFEFKPGRRWAETMIRVESKSMITSQLYFSLETDGMVGDDGFLTRERAALS